MRWKKEGEEGEGGKRERGGKKGWEVGGWDGGRNREGGWDGRTKGWRSKIIYLGLTLEAQLI